MPDIKDRVFGYTLFGYRDRVFGYPYREGLSMPKQLIKYYCPNTLSQTWHIVKHLYAQTKCLDNTIYKSVCQVLFKSPAKKGGDRQTPIDQTLYKTYKGYSQIKCLGKGLFG